MKKENISEKNDVNVRLNRYLARCGLGSRRSCDNLISSGKILINGVIAAKLGLKIDPNVDRIEYAGKVVRIINPLQYFAYHKQKGSVVSLNDPAGRETIYDSLERVGFDCRHLRYVGRLDRNSEGLLLLTNDGDLIHALTHPRFNVKKVYRVKTDRMLNQDDALRMCHRGIQSEGQTLRAGDIRVIDRDGRDDGLFWLEIDLYEGKKRQIRRMLEALGYNVLRLKRIQFGVVKLGNLSRGYYRLLSESEVRGLKSLGYKRKKQVKEI